MSTEFCTIEDNNHGVAVFSYGLLDQYGDEISPEDISFEVHLERAIKLARFSTEATARATFMLEGGDYGHRFN